MGQTSKVWRKLVILAFRLTFAPCVEALLIHKQRGGGVCMRWLDFLAKIVNFS